MPKPFDIYRQVARSSQFTRMVCWACHTRVGDFVWRFIPSRIHTTHRLSGHVYTERNYCSRKCIDDDAGPVLQFLEALEVEDALADNDPAQS